MQDFIELPQIIKDHSEIYSVKLSDLFHRDNKEENKYSIDYLRSLYKTDRDVFIQVVDECSLRGFLFVTEKPNNILPNYTPKPSSYIVATNDEQRFKKINFAHFGLPSFIDRFHVHSDLFFHKIPLEGFKRLNAAIQLDDLEGAFMEAGFLIKDMDEPQDEDETTEGLEENMIEDIFHENKFRMFRGFCRKKGLTTIEEITSDVLEDFLAFPRVGIGKLQDVKDRLEEAGQGTITKKEEKKGPVLQIDHPIALKHPISDLFKENKFNIFNRFCMANSIETVGEIDHNHMELFSKQSGVGKKRVQDVLEQLEYFSNTYKEMYPSHFEGGRMFTYIKNLKVMDLLEVYKLEIESNTSLTIADIEGRPFENIDEIQGDILLDLSDKLKAQKHPKEIIETIGEQLTERETIVLQSRFIHELTLEETAEILSVTRERIRQIEGKTVRKIFADLKNNQFLEGIQLAFPNVKFFSSMDIRELTGEKYAYFIPIFKTKESILSYLPMLDVYYVDQQLDAGISKIDEVIQDLPEKFYLYEHEEALREALISAGFENPSNELIGKTLQNCHFHQYGSLYSRYKLATSDILEQLLRKHVKGSLRLDENGLEKLKQLASQHLNYELDGNLRSIDARLRDTRDIILVDRLTFQWFDAKAFDTAIMDKIEEYLDERFETVSFLNVEEIFEAFEDTVEPLGIRNKHHLYSLIKYFLDEKYSIGQGNTLNIYKDDSKKMSLHETIIDAVRKAGGLCTKDQLEETLRWQRYKIDLAISNSNEMIPWGENQVILFEKIGLTKNEEEELHALLTKTMTQGYTTAGILYKELMFTPTLSPLISQKGIDDHVKLAGIMKAIDPELRGHTNFLYKESSEFTSFDQVILDQFNRESSRQEIREFAIQHGYSSVMAASLLGNLMENGLLVEIDYDTLYPWAELDIEAGAIQQLIDFIEEKMEGKGYICLDSLKGYRRKLPPIDFRWNPYLMKSLLVNNGFRQIHKVYRDYRYDKAILVHEDSTLQTFEELVHQILSNEYDGNMHEVHVYDFLVKKGMLQEQMYDHEKILPQELKEGSLVTVNEIGIVTVRQG